MKPEQKFNLATVAVVLGCLFFSGAAMAVGAYLFEDPVTKKSVPNKTVAGYLGVESGGTVDLQTGPQPTEGQVLIAGCGTSSATSTNTASCAKFGTISTATPDPLGTFFLQGCEGAKWPYCSPTYVPAVRWNQLNLDLGATVTATGTCSAGSDATIVTATAYDLEYRRLFPAGTWTAKLKAKVNANGAAIRIETRVSGSAWFNWTTQSFSNTDYATITASTTQAERLTADTAYIEFRLVATCSTSTTVSVEFAGYGAVGSRIESPLAKEAPRIVDVRDLTPTLAGKEPRPPAGRPGQAVCYTGTSTATTTNKGPCDILTDASSMLGTSPAVDISVGPASAGASTKGSRDDHAHHLGDNYPAPGMLPFAYSTDTSTATGTGNSIMWRFGQERDITGLEDDLAGKEPLQPAGKGGDVVVISGTSTSTGTAKDTKTLTVPVESPLVWRMRTTTGTNTATGTTTKSTANVITESPTLIIDPPPVAKGAVPGGDLFMYFGGNQVRFFETPYPSDTSSEWSVTATTSPTWFNYPTGLFANVVNRFAGESGVPAEYSPTTWVSPGVVSYAISMRSTAAATNHIVFGLCPDGANITTWIQDISVSVTSSTFSIFTGKFSLSDGLYVSSGYIFCMGFYAQAASGTATVSIGVNYTNYTKLNGPWLRSGANAWTF